MGGTKAGGAEPVQEGESNSSPAGRSLRPSSNRRLMERLPRAGG